MIRIPKHVKERADALDAADRLLREAEVAALAKDTFRYEAAMIARRRILDAIGHP